ncbi:MAG: Hsp20/alpha crystallin family protein [Melioribacteraceae bacterium]|nr:Hsp20/alpha crystallin family protein [Melioribacteraceae bacterium]
MYNSQCNAYGSSIYSTRVKDNNDKYILEVPVPGFEKENINLQVKESYLIIDGKTEEHKFSRSFELGKKIDVEKINAELKNGILKVDLPKIESLTKEISIN